MIACNNRKVKGTELLILLKEIRKAQVEPRNLWNHLGGEAGWQINIGGTYERALFSRIIAVDYWMKQYEIGKIPTIRGSGGIVE
jgi:hypothetical protein